MKRSAFLTVPLLYSLASTVSASQKSTIVLLSSDDPDTDDEYTNYLAEALRARGVSVVDPSAVTITLHQRASLVALAFGPLLAVSTSSVSWIETKYGAPRALFAKISIADSELPYGDFTVHNVRATCSFRCMNVIDRSIVKAGKFQATARGEDQVQVVSEAANSAILLMARASAATLAR